MSAHRPGRFSIGAERESDLHRSLKFRYSGGEERTEMIIGDFVCDGIGKKGELIEVQTGSFGPLKKKIPLLLKSAPVKIVHPIILTKYIETYDKTGALLRRRKSNRRGSPWDLFKALLYAPELPLCPGLSIELALVDSTEKRVADGKGSWRRKGVSIAGRGLLAWHGSIPLLCLRDYRRFVPFKKGQEFTVQGLGEKAGINRDIAGKTLYVLTKLKVVERIGKKGNAWVYRDA